MREEHIDAIVSPRHRAGLRPIAEELTAFRSRRSHSFSIVGGVERWLNPERTVGLGSAKETAASYIVGHMPAWSCDHLLVGAVGVAPALWAALGGCGCRGGWSPKRR